MNILTIPDLHGKNVWTSVKIERYDKVIFLGDYVDSKGKVSTEAEIENLNGIIHFKKLHEGKVVLLLGNHDIQYMYFPQYLSSTINYDAQLTFSQLFKENKALFQVAFQFNNHLWSHAGISKSWLSFHYSFIKPFLKEDVLLGIGTALNGMQQEHMDVLATCAPSRGGMSPYGGVFWADMTETYSDYLEGIHQYVGHTKVEKVLRSGDRNSSITYLDCLNSTEEFYVVDGNR